MDYHSGHETVYWFYIAELSKGGSYCLTCEVDVILGERNAGWEDTAHE